jgi:hypothetical protein
MAIQANWDPHQTQILVMRRIVTTCLRKWKHHRPRILGIFTYKSYTKD